MPLELGYRAKRVCQRGFQRAISLGAFSPQDHGVDFAAAADDEPQATDARVAAPDFRDLFRANEHAFDLRGLIGPSQPAANTAVRTSAGRRPGHYG